MDQDAFRETYREINDRYCLFEKGILSGQCSCTCSTRILLAEREGIHCRSDQAQQQCDRLLRLLRHHARFTLKSNDETSALPHGKAMRIQIGGIRGLYTAVHPDRELPLTIDDIHALIGRAREQFNGLDQLPFQEIIKQVASYRGRGRRC